MNKANCWVIETGRGIVGPFESGAHAAEYLQLMAAGFVGPCKILPVMPARPPFQFETEGA